MNNLTFGLLVVAIMVVIAFASLYLLHNGIITMIPLMVTMIKEANGDDLTSKLQNATEMLKQSNSESFAYNELYMSVINKTEKYYYIILGTIEAVLGYFAVTNLFI